MATFRGAFSKHLAPGYRKIIFESYRERPMEGTKIVNMNTSKRAYEEDFNGAGVGPLLKKPEGGSVLFSDAMEGPAKRYTWDTYGRAFRITEEMQDDNLYGSIGSKFSKTLGRSAAKNKEVLLHAPYNNAFDTAYVGFTAGEALCGTHTYLRGGTWSNTPTTQADFDLLTFQAAIEHFHTLQDESGIPAVFIPKYVLHSAPSMWIVNQVLKSTGLPNSNQNDINYARGMADPLLDHYLTDSDAWFVIADQHDVNYFDRKPFSVSSFDDPFTGDACFKGTRRAGSGFGDPRGIYASSGG